MTDPFCPHAFGAKVPDNSSVRTVPYTKHYSAGLNSDADGNFSYVYAPSYLFRGFYVGMLLGLACDYGSTITANSPTYADRVRLVSVGLRIRGVLTPLNASGMIYLRTLSDTGSNGTTSAGFVAIPNVTDYRARQCLDLSTSKIPAGGITVLPERTANPIETMYPPGDELNVQASKWVAQGFHPVVISGFGLPANSNCLVVEVIEHWEIALSDNSDIMAFATPPPPYNPHVNDAVREVASRSKSFLLDSVEQFGRKVVTMAGQALTTAIGMRMGLPGKATQLLLVD